MPLGSFWVSLCRPKGHTANGFWSSLKHIGRFCLSSKAPQPKIQCLIPATIVCEPTNVLLASKRDPRNDVTQ